MTDLRLFLRSLRTAPAFAHIIAVGALAVWVVKATWLDFIPNDSHAMVGVGHVVDGTLSAVIAGYVFFAIFAVYPDYRQRLALAPILYERIRRVVGDCLGIIEKIEKASSTKLPLLSTTEAVVTAAFAATKTAMPPPAITAANGAPLTWPQFFAYRHGRTVAAVDELLQQGRFLDAELITILVRIRSAPFYVMSDAAAISEPMSNADLSAWGPSFWKLIVQSRELVDWHDAHLMPGVGPFKPLIPG